MALTVIKAERVVRTLLGLLEREVTLPSLVWRDAGGDFAGAKNDTITIRLPSYFKANSRDLRAGTPRSKSNLLERSVNVTLDKDIYGVIPITDEELTLDLESFTDQIVVPVANGIVRSLEDELIGLMQGATYANTITYSAALIGQSASAYNPTVDARTALNDSRVPAAGRAIVLGSALEALFLKDPLFVKVNESGSSETMRQAQIGSIAGFPVFTAQGLDPDEGYAFHRTAYVMSTKAPLVPRGVAWGASMSWQGFALRVAQQVDPDELVDNFHADAWIGTNTVVDRGAIDAVTGVFEPAVDPAESGAADHFVRAVKLELGS